MAYAQRPVPAANRLLQQKIADISSGTKLSERARLMAIDLAEQVVLVGVLKTYARGPSFVECAETQALFGRDVSVHPSQCEGVAHGEQVSFRVQIKQGKPHAWDVCCPPSLPYACGGDPSEDAAGREDVGGWNEAARAWRPSTEAHERSGMAALTAHKMSPQRFPAPVLRQGAFVGWASN